VSEMITATGVRLAGYCGCGLSPQQTAVGRSRPRARHVGNVLPFGILLNRQRHELEAKIFTFHKFVERHSIQRKKIKRRCEAIRGRNSFTLPHLQLKLRTNLLRATYWSFEHKLGLDKPHLRICYGHF
jgi:hypothetical protein